MIRNLKDELFAITGQKQDARFSSWAKEVCLINKNGKGAFMFVGPFVNDGTIEVSDKPHLFLVASVDGSRKYQTITYNVIMMSKDGALTLTDIRDTNEKMGWELRIRPQIEELLKKTSPASFQEPLAIRIQKNLERYGELKSELERQVKKCLEAQEGFMGFTSGVQVQLILNVSEQMLGRIHQPEKWDALLETFCKTAVEEIKGEK